LLCCAVHHFGQIFNELLVAAQVLFGET
jgi:hypothetical protein